MAITLGCLCCLFGAFVAGCWLSLSRSFPNLFSVFGVGASLLHMGFSFFLVCLCLFFPRQHSCCELIWQRGIGTTGRLLVLGSFTCCCIALTGWSNQPYLLCKYLSYGTFYLQAIRDTLLLLLRRGCNCVGDCLDLFEAEYEKQYILQDIQYILQDKQYISQNIKYRLQDIQYVSQDIQHI